MSIGQILDDMNAWQTRIDFLEDDLARYKNSTDEKKTSLVPTVKHFLAVSNKELDKVMDKLKYLSQPGNLQKTWADDVTKLWRIEDFAAKHTELKASSNGELRGLCPIRKEKTASFYVNPAKQVFHCFGCGAKGGIIKLVQELFNVDYKESLAMLRQKEPMRQKKSDIDLPLIKAGGTKWNK